MNQAITIIERKIGQAKVELYYLIKSRYSMLNIILTFKIFKKRREIKLLQKQAMNEA